MINLNKIGNIGIIVSTIIIIVGFVVTYAVGGIALGIDFKSGVSMQVQFTTSPSIEEIRTALEDFGAVSVQRISNTEGRYLIKSDLGESTDSSAATEAGADSNAAASALEQRLKTEFGQEQVDILEVAFTNPRYSGSVARQSIVLTLSALVLILLYIWVRFRLRYSISAIAALVHDVLMMIMFIGVTRTELSVTTVAAILTIIGYSLNDTVVIFDRIRENSNMQTGSMNFFGIVNTSIMQSLSRTIITSLTTLLAVIAIYIFSTGLVRDFALCVIFGVIVGTYSSIFIASPVLILWNNRSPIATAGAIKSRQKDTAVAIDASKGASDSKKKKSVPVISVDTDRIKQELMIKRQQQQKKKKKKKK